MARATEDGLLETKDSSILYEQHVYRLGLIVTTHIIRDHRRCAKSHAQAQLIPDTYDMAFAQRTASSRPITFLRALVIAQSIKWRIYGTSVARARGVALDSK